MHLVIIESPFRGRNPKERARNLTYARRALLDSINQKEIPFASHLLYTQVLDDRRHDDRELGLGMNLALIESRHFTVRVYEDYGISSGMARAIRIAHINHIPVTYRSIGPNPS